MLEFRVKPYGSNNSILDILLIINKGIKHSGLTLIDSGANLPMWLDGFDSFIDSFPNAYIINAENYVQGLGINGETLPVYIIPDFILSDGKEEIHYLNLPIIVGYRDFSAKMLISYPMINKLNVSHIAFSNKSGNYTHQKIRIHPKNSVYRVGKYETDVRLLSQSERIKFHTQYRLDSIYIFLQ